MKIAMLTNNYRPFVGGVPISVERQAQELVKLGHQVTVFAPMYEAENKTQEENFREKLMEEDRKSPERVIRYRSQKKKMDNGMVYPAICPTEIFEVFERESFDRIHVHHPMFAGSWALWLGKKYRIPVIYTYHTRYEDYVHYIPCLRLTEGSTAVKRKAVEWIQKSVIPSYMGWFCDRCDLVIAPSAGMSRIIRGYGVETPVAVLPTGLDGDFFRKDAGRSQEIREQYSRGKKHLLVTVSRLEEEKNYGFLLRGITELRHVMGDSFHVLIIGDGSRRLELKVRASILGIQDVVTFVGNVPNDQVKDYLGAADLFLFASKSETQGIVLAEALAAGTPVTALHAVGTDDIIEDGVNGFLTEEKEAVWAAKAAEALDEEVNRRMRRAALISAENYRASRLAIREEMLYNQCGFGKGDRFYETEEDYPERSAVALH